MEQGDSIFRSLKAIVNGELFKQSLAKVLAVAGTREFLEEYAKKMDGEVNSARRYVDWVMTFVRTQALLCQLTPAQVAELLPAKTIDQFLECVHVLSRAKPGAKFDVDDQEAFWRAARSGDPIPRSERHAARDPARVLRHQLLFASRGFWDAIVSVLEDRADRESCANTIREAYSALENDFRRGEFSRDTLRLIAEPVSVRVFLIKVGTTPESAALWEKIIE
jgi:hypothetical protein